MIMTNFSDAFIQRAHPRYWLLWGVFGFLWLLTRLPLPWQLCLGEGIGSLVYRIAKRRTHIARVNIQHCFPNYTAKEQELLVKQHFMSLGMGLFEMLNAWWTTEQRVEKYGYIEGLEHLQTALEKGNGVILLCGHFSSLELSTRYLTPHVPIHVTYRQHENPVIEYFMGKNRHARTEKAVPRDAVRTMIRSLRANKVLWFAPDQNFGHKNSVFADFFSIPAATNTATARLAKVTGAAVVPLFPQRLPNKKGYRVVISPALTDFPSGDDQHDAQRINHLIEEHARCAPEQYLWAHRRFKDRPEGESDFYKKNH